MRYVYAFLLLGLFACQKESKLSIPYTGDKIVVNSMIQPDSLIYIRVTSSKQVREYGNLAFPELSAAKVTVTENGAALPAPQWKVINGLGYFVSAAPAEKGKQYAIHVDNEGLTSVDAADSTPQQPVIKDANAQQDISRVRFTLQDDGSKVNYYRIRVFNADSNFTPIMTDTVKFRLDPAYNNSFIDILGNSYYSEVMLSDERINGQETLFVLQTEKQVTASYMIVEVSALTSGAYKYLQETYSQRLEDKLDFLFDPVSIYTNVINGYGIVAGIYPGRATLKVE
jgi:hypothetical protein